MFTTKQKITVAIALQNIALFFRALTGRGPLTKVRRRGLWWSLDLREGIDFTIWLTGAFEPLTVRAYRRLIHPGDIVFDIGANIGAHTLYLAQAAGAQGMVYAFEPTDFAFTKLQQNLSLNPDLASRTRCCQLMLLDHADTAPPSPVYASWPLTNEGDLHPLHRGRLMAADHAQTTTLDAFLEHANVPRVDFMKVDIDGFESSMLRGAGKLLLQYRPKMIIELAPHQLDEYGTSIEELVSLLNQAGYMLQDITTGAALPADGAALRRLIVHEGSRNAVAIPS